MRILDTTSAAETGSAFQTLFERRGGYRALQADISAAGTVTVEGRNAPDMEWVTLATFTSTGAEMVATMREFRASVAGNTGTVKVEIDV
ncbi:MAG: hypothetical protein HRU14_18405 [Planctomycetes bacterium]|nr:hypothetical protein [Planctomycetota bacterium]